MNKFLLTATCALGFTALSFAEPVVLPNVYVRGTMSNWELDESTKFTYTGDIDNPTLNGNGEYEMSVYMDILTGEFKLVGREWSDFNYGAQGEDPNVTADCTKQAWNNSSVNFNLNGKTLINVTLTFYYNPDTWKASYLKVQGREVSPESITVAAPSFSAAPGAVYEGTTFVLNTATEGATVYYTTDDSTPYETWTQYIGRSITINEPTTFKAIAVKKGMFDSAVTTASYTIIDPNISIDPSATSATFDFENASNLTPAVTVPSENAAVTDLSNKFLKSNVVTVAFSGNGGNSDIPSLLWNQNGIDLHLYAPQYFTVSVPEGFIIGDITFKHYDSDNLAGLSCSAGTYAVDSDDTKKATWTCKMGDKAPYSTVENVTFTVTENVKISAIEVNYKPGKPTGVDNIAVDDENAPAEYYNLQGVRVDNPTPGLYIVRRGNTATKTLVR